MQNKETFAQALGWFSIGLGLAEVLAPRRLAKTIGVADNPDNEALVRLLGLREIASGIAILAQSHPLGAVRSRVGGDAMDLALLGAAMNAPDADRNKVGMAIAAVAGITALDVLCQEQLRQSANGAQSGISRQSRLSREAFPTNGSPSGQQTSRKENGMDVTETITINSTPEELYTYWHDFENLATFMNHLEAVQYSGDGRSHWKAKAPAGQTVEWDAEIVDDQPNRRIAWRSLEGADINNSGVVEFTPATGGRGTIVRVQLQYNPPGGALGAGIAKLFGEEPSMQVYEDLHRFKQVLETGEILRSDACLDGIGSKQRPGQPPETFTPAQTLAPV